MNNLGPIFWQNTLPLMITILVAVGGAVTAGWISNSNLSKRLDDTNLNLGKRLDEIIIRLERIEVKVE